MVAKERLNYFQGQFLGAEDFKAEQAYHRDMRRRHNLAHHTWGIVIGLELVQRETEGGEGVDVYVQPGMATDGYGREIVVSEPHKLTAADFAGFDTSGFKKIYIAYDEERARRPPFGFASCEEGNSFARVRETFRLVVEPKESAIRDGITVAGKLVPPPPYPDPPPDLTIPADESVPYQELPDDEADPHWAVRLGSVEWDHTKQIFVKAETEVAKAKLIEGRAYVGVVAEQLLAPADTLRLRPRTTPLLPDGKPAGPDDLNFASVEGRLRVDGRIVAKKDVHLHGGQLSFKTSGGGDENIPLWMQRQQNDGAPGFNLRVHIGDAADKAEGSKARLSVGPRDGAKEKMVFGVRGDDRVEIPTGALDFGNQTRQMIHLWKEEYGIGVQGGTLYLRTAGQFCWFRGGVHSDTMGDPGENGASLMRLDSQGRLHFGAQTRQMLNLWKEEYGIGIQAGTLYFRTANQFAWFRNGVHNDAMNDPGNNGASLMRLDGQGRLHFGAEVRQMLNLWKEEYGIGVQSGTLYFRTAADFCWFRGGVHSDGNTQPGAGGALAMKLDNTGSRLVVNNNVRTRHVDGKVSDGDALDHLFLNWNTGLDVIVGNTSGTKSDLIVSGDLIVNGSAASVFHAHKETKALRVNPPPDLPRQWSISYGGVGFKEVYTAFVVLQGYSLWDYEDNLNFTPNASNHAQGTWAIPQHVFVRLDSFDKDTANGVCYCSESNVANETDNTVLFTVVVLGRK